MQARRKPYRVETMDRVQGNANWRVNGHALNGHNHSHHDEIMSELRALRSLVYAAGLKQHRRFVLDVVE